MNRLEEDQPIPTKNRLVGLGALAADGVIDSPAARCGQGEILGRFEPFFKGLGRGRTTMVMGRLGSMCTPLPEASHFSVRAFNSTPINKEKPDLEGV